MGNRKEREGGMEGDDEGDDLDDTKIKRKD